MAQGLTMESMYPDTPAMMVPLLCRRQQDILGCRAYNDLVFPYRLSLKVMNFTCVFLCDPYKQSNHVYIIKTSVSHSTDGSIPTSLKH